MNGHLWCAVRGAAAVLLALIVACAENQDLTRAIRAGVGRDITKARTPVPMSWVDLRVMSAGNDSLVRSAVSLCWLKDALVVADGSTQRLLVFHADGTLLRKIGGRGAEPGEFLLISSVRCSRTGNYMLVADEGSRTVSLFDADGTLRRVVDAPTAPGFTLYLGDFAILPDGTWFDSWLGITRTLGPYLTDEEWVSARLVRYWSEDGRLLRSFGVPDVYNGTVARRVFNRTFLAAHRDTLWVLVQGSASVRAFDLGGNEIGQRIYLPIYYRGSEPRIKIKEPPAPDRSSFRINTLVYQPNVRDLSVYDDSLFVTIRYYDWRIALRGPPGGRWIGYWPRSAIEVFDRAGHVLGSFAVPGRVTEIAVNHGGRVAVITSARDETRRVLVGRIGELDGNGGEYAVADGAK